MKENGRMVNIMGLADRWLLCWLVEKMAGKMGKERLFKKMEKIKRVNGKMINFL